MINSIETIDIRFCRALCEVVSQQRNEMARHLADGKAKDWADYQRRVGVLEGLALARDMAETLAKKAEAREQARVNAFRPQEGMNGTYSTQI